MDLASVVAALASVGVRVSGSTPNSSVQGDSSRACPTGLAGPEPSGTINDPGQHFHEGHWFCTHYCLLSTALTLSVPCRPMPMVSSVSQVAAYQDCSHPASVCLVDHVLHGYCPNVMTLVSQRRTVAYYTRGEGQARCYEARCVFPPWGQASPQLGPLTGPDPWGSTLPYRVYHTPKCATYVCMCLTSLPSVAPGDRASLTSDRRS